MADTRFTNRVRIGGSGFTIFSFGGQPISFCQQVNHTSPQPVGNGSSAIQPMDEPYPIEIITPAAAGPGQLTLNLFELWGQGNASKVWDRLGSSLTNPAGNVGPFGSTDGSNASTNLAIGTDGVFNGAVDIVDIFIRQAQADPTQLNITKIIRPLPLTASTAPAPYTEEYHGCIISNVVDGEQIEVGTLEVIKQITVMYRFLTRNGTASAGFALRDSAI